MSQADDLTAKADAIRQSMHRVAEVIVNRVKSGEIRLDEDGSVGVETTLASLYTNHTPMTRVSLKQGLQYHVEAITAAFKQVAADVLYGIEQGEVVAKKNGSGRYYYVLPWNEEPLYSLACTANILDAKKNLMDALKIAATEEIMLYDECDIDGVLPIRCGD